MTVQTASTAASTAASLTLPADESNPKAQKLIRQMTNAWLMRLYMLKSLPLAFIAGLRVHELDGSHCVVSVPYGWRTQNPFRSTYFAAQSMAAELSTGAIAMLAVRLAPLPVSMLIVDLEATFGKKATSRAFFTCEGGEALFAAVRETLETGEATSAKMATVGRMADGTEVSRFSFTWSFKKKSRG